MLKTIFSFTSKSKGTLLKQAIEDVQETFKNENKIINIDDLKKEFEFLLEPQKLKTQLDKV